MRKLVAFYGGSFSPIHCGHIRIVFSLLEGGHVSRVILVPASDEYKKAGLLPATERIERARSVFRLMEDVVEISTVDTDKPFWPSALDTADELVRTRLDSASEELVWVVGGDRMAWIAQNDDLLKMVGMYRFIVFERPSYEREYLLRFPNVGQFAKRITFLPHWKISVSPS